MRLEELRELPRIWRTLKSPLPYLLARRRRGDVATRDVELRSGHVVRLRGGTRDAHVFHRIFVNDEYRLRGLDLSGAQVIDVGAHGGLFALRAAISGARVLCVEPAPDNLELLRHHVTSNHLSGQVAVRAAALCGSIGPVTLRREGDPYGYAVARGDTASGSALTVEGTTLAALMDEARIERCALLKLDCEGSEYEIVGGAPDDVLRRCDRVRMEFHLVPGGEQAPLALRARLEGLGFRIDLFETKRNGRQGYLFATMA